MDGKLHKILYNNLVNAKSACFATLLTVVFVPELRGGAIVSLVPSQPGPYDVSDPSTLNFTVDVMLRLDENSPQSAWFTYMRFDSARSTLGLESVVTHPQSDFGPVRFWDLSGAVSCQQFPSDCGVYHYIDGDFSDEIVDLFLIVNIFPPTGHWFELTQSTDIRIGVASVSLPQSPGDYVLDLLNGDEVNPKRGAELTIGSEHIYDTITFTARDGSIDGGIYVFSVVPEPATAILLLTGWGFIFSRRRCH